MSETQVLGGSWKFENDERVFQGNLHFNKEERFITLNLLIPAEDNVITCAPYTGKIPFVTGKLFNGSNIVLFDCITGNEETVLGAYSSQMIYAKYAFWGLNAKTIDELVFKEVSVDFGDLLSWYGLCNYKRQYSDDYSKQSVIWEYKEPAKIACKDNLTIVFQPCNGGTTDPYAKKYELTQRVIVSFEYNQPVSWNNIIDDIQVIQYLIGLGTTQRIEIEEATYQHSSLFDEFPGAEPSIFYRDCEVLFGAGKINHLSHVYPFQYLFKMKDLIEIDGFSNWYKAFDKLQPVLDLYNIAYTNNATVVSLFLNLAQALETFHARFYANTWGKYKERANQRLATFEGNTPNRSNWEAALLGTDYKNKSILLKFRLADLCFDVRYSFSFSEISLFDFVEKAANTRNYYTHYDEGKKGKSFANEFLPTVNGILMSLLEYHTMLIIGFSQENAKGKIGKRIADLVSSYRLRSKMIKVNPPY